MHIRYNTEKLKNICEDEKQFSKEYDKKIFSSFTKWKRFIESSDDIHHFVRICVGFRTEKKEPKIKGIWKSRLNDKWRIEFYFDEEEIMVEIRKIHNHKY